jgi:hypothetical protein
VLTATENTHGLHSNIENYLETRGGSVMDFYNYKAAGQRIPEAFFNALSENDQGRLRGTDQDPFFKDGYGPVEIAVAWLLETEDR